LQLHGEFDVNASVANNRLTLSGKRISVLLDTEEMLSGAGHNTWAPMPIPSFILPG